MYFEKKYIQAMNISISKIAKQIGISQGFLSNILCGRRKPHWKTAKKLGAVTNTSPIIWLEGSPQEIKQALSKNQEAAWTQLIAE